MRINVRWKLLASYFLVVVLVLAFTNLLLISSIENKMISIRGDNLLGSARIVAAESSRYINKQDYLNLVVQDNAHKYRARILIFNHDGEVMADSLADDSLTGRVLHYDEVKSALKGASKSLPHYLNDSGWVMYAAAPITDGSSVIGAAMISAHADDIFSFIDQIKALALSISWLRVAHCLFLALYVLNL